MFFVHLLFRLYGFSKGNTNRTILKQKMENKHHEIKNEENSLSIKCNETSKIGDEFVWDDKSDLNKMNESEEIYHTEKDNENSTDFQNDEYSASTDYDSKDDSTSQKLISMSPELKCEHCSKTLRGIHSLKNHCMRKHGNQDNKNFLCDKCPNRFYTDFEFNRHYQTHYSIKNYLCDLCSKKFFQKHSLELHLRYHKNDRRYQCEICRKKFFTNHHLKRHCLIHTNKRDFKCEPCGRSFRYKEHLRRHLQSLHIGVRSYSCSQCHRSFMYLSQLKFHERSHTEMLFKCKHCKQCFEKQILLKTHQKKCKEHKTVFLPFSSH